MSTDLPDRKRFSGSRLLSWSAALLMLLPSALVLLFGASSRFVALSGIAGVLAIVAGKRIERA